MPTGRTLTGTGHGTNPVDGDRVTITLGFRNGTIATAAALGMFVGHVADGGEGLQEYREFKTGEEARAHGDTFGGCEGARKAARHVAEIFIGRSLDEALAIQLDEFVAAIGGIEPPGRTCVAAVLQAVRRAIFDVRARVLAEEIVEARHARR